MSVSSQVDALAARIAAEFITVRDELEPPVTSVASRTGDVTLSRSDVGLSNVDNTSDASKPLSSAATTALAAKANSADVVPNTRTVAGKPLSANVALVKGDVGLSNVDNTSDASKPVSSAAQTALNAKANSADVVPNTRTVAGKALSANVTLVKGDVGLGNVDNTSDVNKPVSTAQQTALDGKASTASVAAKIGSGNSSVTGVEYYANTASLPGTGVLGVIYFVDAV